MSFHAAKIICALGTISLSPLLTSGGAEVRASFLQDTNAVSQTIEFLINCGCTRQGTTVFENAVRQYLREPCDFDLAKFPKPINGFYCFASPRELIASLSNQLVETRHSFDFNCTDAVIALADRRLQTALRPDDMVGPILATTWATNTHTEAISFAATARDAFSLGWSSWYREATDPLFPASMLDARICLSPCLLRWYVLPFSTREDSVEARVLEVLRTTWQHEALKFPSQFEVVLFHNVDLSSHMMCTSHAGLLFHSKKGCTYLEKAGGRGPFVRLDLAERSDLVPWLAVPFRDYTNASLHHFVTFNNGTIKKIRLQ